MLLKYKVKVLVNSLTLHFFQLVNLLRCPPVNLQLINSKTYPLKSCLSILFWGLTPRNSRAAQR